MPALYGLSYLNIAYLSSVNQISITDVSNSEKSIKKSLDIEPTIIGLCENILAFGNNNKVQFLTFDEDSNFKEVLLKVSSHHFTNF